MVVCERERHSTLGLRISPFALRRVVLSSRMTLSPRVVFSHVHEERRVLVFGDYVGVVVGGLHQSLVKAVEYAYFEYPSYVIHLRLDTDALAWDPCAVALFRAPEPVVELDVGAFVSIQEPSIAPVNMLNSCHLHVSSPHSVESIQVIVYEIALHPQHGFVPWFQLGIQWKHLRFIVLPQSHDERQVWAKNIQELR